MTKDEYTQSKAEIIARLGKPVRGDGFENESNESYKELCKLRGKLLSDIRLEQRKAKETEEAVQPLQNSLQALESLISEPKRKEYARQPLPEIVVLDKDLKGFNEVERAVLKEHFNNMDLEPKQLANKFGKSYQWTAGLLHSREVQHLETKYFYEVLKAETMKSLLRAVKAGDVRITEGAAEFLKVMSTNVETQGSMPLVDKELEAKLKELGDGAIL